jgi:hypothetical protein
VLCLLWLGLFRTSPDGFRSFSVFTAFFFGDGGAPACSFFGEVGTGLSAGFLLLVRSGDPDVSPNKSLSSSTTSSISTLAGLFFLGDILIGGVAIFSGTASSSSEPVSVSVLP